MQNHPQLEASHLNGVVGTELLFPLMLKMRIRHHAILSHSRPMERIWQTLHFLNQRFLCYSWQLGELKILEFQEKRGIKTFLRDLGREKLNWNDFLKMVLDGFMDYLHEDIKISTHLVNLIFILSF